MRFSSILIASLTGTASSFVPQSVSKAPSALFVASPPKASATTNVDKTMKGIDSDAGAFDPTAGENSALTRNNNDEVWVKQVSQWFRSVVESYFFRRVASLPATIGIKALNRIKDKSTFSFAREFR